MTRPQLVSSKVAGACSFRVCRIFLGPRKALTFFDPLGCCWFIWLNLNAEEESGRRCFQRKHLFGSTPEYTYLQLNEQIRLLILQTWILGMIVPCSVSSPTVLSLHSHSRFKSKRTNHRLTKRYHPANAKNARNCYKNKKKTRNTKHTHLKIS